MIVRIGNVNNKAVFWDKVNNTVTIQNTNVLIVGVKTYLEAIKACRRNLKNFKAM